MESSGASADGGARYRIGNFHFRRDADRSARAEENLRGSPGTCASLQGGVRHATRSIIPHRAYSRDGASPILPRAYSPASVGFTGLAFCEGCGLGGFYESTLFYGSFVTKEIRNLKLSSSRLSVVADRLALRPGRRVLALERAPDGTLYYSSGGAIWRLEKI